MREAWGLELVICAFGIKSIMDNDANGCKTFLAFHLIKDMVTAFTIADCVSAGICNNEMVKQVAGINMVTTTGSLFAIFKLKK